MSSSKDSESESPKERLAKYGADSLSIQELLAVLLFPGHEKEKSIEIAVIILVHNHPSGDPTPSEQDELLTRQLCLCGRVLSVEVLDHIIIGFPDHVGLKNRGLA